MPRSITAVLSFVLVAVLAACAQNEAPASDSNLDPQVEALVGSTGSAGESQLQTLGFAVAGGGPEAGAAVTYWRRAGDGTCIRVRTVDGRYEAIESAAAPDCDAAETATRVVAEADPGGYRTVCGVMVDGSPSTRPGPSPRVK